MDISTQVTGSIYKISASDIYSFLEVIMVSYFLGILSSETVAALKITDVGVKPPHEFGEGYGAFFKAIFFIERKYGKSVVVGLERVIYIRHIGGSICSSSLISLLLLAIYSFATEKYNLDIFITILAFAMIFLASFRINRHKTSQINQIINELVKVNTKSGKNM